MESRKSAEEKMEHEIEMVSFFYSDLTYAKAVSGAHDVFHNLTQSSNEPS